jgi:hypothetical protein
MRANYFAGTLAIALVVSAATGAAQVLEQPLRSAPPRESDRTTQQLNLTVNASGGYDDNLGAENAFSSQSLDTTEGSYIGLGGLAVQYSRGRRARSFTLEGSSYLLSYSNLNVNSPVGGQVRFGGETSVGRSAKIEFVQQVRSDPYVSFGGFGPLDQDLGPGTGPDANPVNGLAPNRSWGAFTSASFDWRWTPRMMLSTGYDYSRSEYTGGGAGFNNRTHVAHVAFNRFLTRTTALGASYRFADTMVVEPLLGQGLPVHEQTVQAFFSYEKALSRTRRMEVNAGAGATHIETVSRFGRQPFEYWAPSGHASLRTDIGRTWAVSATYRRGVTFLDGITPEFFFADAALLRAEGRLARRVDLAFSAGYSNGAQPVGQVSGRYDTFTLAAEAQFLVADPWGVTVSYNHNNYQLYGFPPPPLGPVPQFERNAIRVGLTYSFTLSSARRERPTRPGRTDN